MSIISELRDEHRQLEKQGRQLGAIVSAPVADAAAVAGMRWQMRQALFDHCAREDAEIYQVIFASGDAAATRIAEAYRQEHSRLSRAFAHYIGDWPVARISREWDAFRADTLAILHGLAARMTAEEDTLYAHAERLRLRRAA